MPRAAKELTALKVSRLTEPGLYAVGGVPGLHLQVTPSGARSWIARLTVGVTQTVTGKNPGKVVQHRRDFGLGSFPEVSLAEAREKAREFRKKVANNVDPLAETMAAKARAAAARAALMTVNAAVHAFIDEMDAQKRWRDDPDGVSKRKAWLDQHIAPHIGGLLVSDVELPHVLKVLKPLWVPHPTTAEKVKGLLQNTFDWAKAHGYRKGDNPAGKELLNKVLPPLEGGDGYAWLHFDRLPEFMRELRAHEGATARALEFTILSAVRTSEVLGALWTEFDLDAAVWTIPAERMKGKYAAEHRVPLTPSMLALLRAQREVAKGSCAFPSPGEDKPLSDNAMRSLLIKMNYKDAKGRRVTTHGFRSTFSTWASECTDHSGEVREMALAHAIKNKVEAAYRRGDLFDKRRALMADWDSFCRQ